MELGPKHQIWYGLSNSIVALELTFWASCRKGGMHYKIGPCTIYRANSDKVVVAMNTFQGHLVLTPRVQVPKHRVYAQSHCYHYHDS